MELDDLRRNWDAFGKKDPMWAILTGADKSDGRWDLDDFFQTGRVQAAGFVERVAGLGMRCEGRLLDFGCGIGRLTQAFADTFAECVGVDIAASMIDRANEVNRHPDRVRYVLNERDDLSVFGDEEFDVVFSFIVLQHMQPSIAKRYVREFFRIAKPGATLLFQMPTHVDPQPLPDEAFAATIAVQDAPREMSPGSTARVTVEVRNTSPVTWHPGVDPGVNIDNHWRTARGRHSIVVFDDARAPLPSAVAPGDSVRQVLEVRAPTEPREYLLEVDLVQELVAWFATRGSTPARVPVRVSGARRRWFRKPPSPPDELPDTGTIPASAATPVPQTDLEPVMEVYGIERDEMIALIDDCGGTVVSADPSTDARPWEGFTYFVTKRGH